MSIPNRAYRLAKAYLNQFKDRLESLDAELAEKELQAEADQPASGPAARASSRDDVSAEGMMRRAEERIAAARAEAAARNEAVESRDAREAVADDPNAADYRLMGVPVGSDWNMVQSAYEKLSRRCDPRRFPDGSVEQRDAERILERVNVAYEALRKRLDPTESRFAKLEL